MDAGGSNSSPRRPREELVQELGRRFVEAGLTPSEHLVGFLDSAARTPDPDRALVNLLRFLESGFSLPIMRDFAASPALLRVALELFAQSQYIADILVRDPELFRWLTTTGMLNRRKDTEEMLGEMRSAVGLFSRMEKKTDAVRRVQRRELLRIGAREILEESDVADSAAELAGLADAVLRVTWELAREHFSHLKGTALNDSLAVIALGKLGGQELNFSSDIDLMFVYEDDRDYPEPFERIHTYHELHVRMAEFIVRVLTEATGEGHLYRVDMRLRPDGHAGPLAQSRAGYRSYYEQRGELWERQMLLKARCAAGDNTVGKSFLDDLRPFVYPRVHLVSPLEEISRIKRKIEQALKRGEANVKLGVGGIRDVEFIVQALQLLHAGTHPRIRRLRTIDALEALADDGILTQEDAVTLGRAYRVLRRIEHRLQLHQGRQTHELPDSEEEMSALARRLGFATLAAFEAELSAVRADVRSLFRTVFPSEPEGEALRSVMAAGGTWETLSVLNRESAEKHRLELLREALPLNEAVAGQGLVEALRKYGAPDWGLSNLVHLARSEGIHRSFEAAVAKPELLDLLTLVASRSRILTGRLAGEPLLFETLAGLPYHIFGEDWGWAFLREDDPGRYKRYNEFKLLTTTFLGQLTFEELLVRLSRLADGAMQMLYGRAAAEAGQAFPIPPNCVVGMGKLGGGEITYGSDLDLVVVYEDARGESAPAMERLVQKFLELMANDDLYRVDLRLRPEGENAPLSSAFSYYREYLRTRASLWERQALMKARVICGDRALGERVRDLFLRHAFESALPVSWTDDISQMRGRVARERSRAKEGGIDVKTGEGGLADLEFGLQALQLRFGATRDEFRCPGYFDLCRRLGTMSGVASLGLAVVRENLEFLRTLETFIRLNAEQPSSVLPQQPELLQALAAGVGCLTAEELKGRLERVRHQNTKFFQDALKLSTS